MAAPTDTGPSPTTLSVHRVGAQVVLDYLLSHLGFFTVLPVLPLVLAQLTPGAGPVEVGAILFAFNFMIRGASLLCAGVLNRIPVDRAAAGGLVLAAGGFVAVPYAPGQLGVLGCLIVTGGGISINGLIMRVYVAKTLPDSGRRNTVFSAVQVAVNVSAALGPVIGNVLFGYGYLAPMLLGVAAMYLAAAVIVFATVPSGLLPSAGEIRPPLRLGLLSAIVSDRHVRQVSAATAVGSFLYAQFFSAIALHVARLTEQSLARAGVFTLNAVCVVLVQMPVAAYTQRRLAAGQMPLRFLVTGVLTFVAAFWILALTGAAYVGVITAVVVFSVAETLFTPMVNTAYAAVPGERPLVELFNLRQIAATAGESLGAFAGGTLFLVAARQGHVGAYWMALAVGGIAATMPLLRRKGPRCVRC